MLYRTKTFKAVSVVLLIAMMFEVITPTVASALTQGPTQPEFSSFEPVSAGNLVNPFTGEFSYNLPVLSIPGPNGMGYALSLSYHSGSGMEDEASWVGSGWTLNPGAITRVKRGFPDDYNNASVRYWNNVRDNWTATVTKRLGLEFFSREVPSTPLDPGEPRQNWAKLNGFLTHRYNNYKGYGFSWGVSGGVMGIANLGYTETDNVGSWSYSVNPMALLEKLKVVNLDALNFDKQGSWFSNALKGAARQAINGAVTQSSSSTGLFGMFNFNDYSMPYNTTEYSGTAIDIAGSVEGDPFAFPIGVEGGIKGSYSTQKGKKKADRQVFGYMYSGEAQDEAALMDYYLEKEGSYQKRDLYLPIPFSNADQFIVSAEGLGGSFRLHHSKPGKFRPNKAKSSTDMFHVNVDFHLGGAFGWGGDLGYGKQNLTVENWYDGGFNFIPQEQEDEPSFFRFAEDMGGSVEYADNDDPVNSEIELNLLGQVSNVAVNGMFSGKRVNSQGESATINPEERSGRSSYIAYNKNKDMIERAPYTCFYPYYSGSNVMYRRHGKRDVTSSLLGSEKGWLDRNESAIREGIGEFAITKENGMEYIYDLPVYSRNEINLQYGLTGVSANNIKDNFLAYHYEPLSESDKATIIGEESNSPYASTFLLTEIHSPDYVDRTNNGPTSDDLGGYVLFKYKKVAGSMSKSGSLDEWYRWRSPYNGLHYQRNALSDPFDDVGSVNSGYKEIYLLDTIETKTHIAIFNTEPRKDGYEAVHNEQTAASNSSASTVPSMGFGESTLERLNSIELYSKNASNGKGKLLVTVNFDYDYSLCENLPNSEVGEGKLTLKKLWFEYEGVLSARISPYEFGYEYQPSSHFANVPFTGSGEAYEKIVKYGDGLIGLITGTPGSPGYFNPQNPDYSPFDGDRWGNYQYDGKTRHQRFNRWVNQNPEPEFDPAAWQLKWIKLPSGGEIHVQYEQHDYRFIQHRPAMVMMNLGVRTVEGGEFKYEIDVDNILPLVNDPITGTRSDTKYVELLDSLETQIRRYYINGVNGDPEHIYFRFVYALQGNNADLDRCSSEFISGYVRVSDVGVSGSGLASTLWVKLGDPTKEYTLPDKVCENYVRTSRAGIIKMGSCDAAEAGVLAFDDNVDVDDGWEAIWWLLGDFGSYYDSGENCKTINPADSYLRIPLPASRAKKGGGVRVKRVLTYDKGLEPTEDAALYGTEYLYETEDGLSSGVAVNEPPVGREENSLIGLINKRSAQNGYEKVFSGEDRSQFEGPIGESILPGASVGYSRVVAKNIYPGKTTTGFIVNEFYTARDYPFDLQYSNAGEDVTDLKADRTPINTPFDVRYSLMTGIFNRSYSSLLRAQGTRFVLNSMHGKPKRVSSYGGNYRSGAQATAPIDDIIHEYFQPGEKVPVMHGSSIDDISYAWLGKEMEVVFESRNVQEVTVDGSLQIDFGLGIAFFFPLPFFSGHMGVGFSNSDNALKTFVSSKVVRYPAIEKRSIIMKDGVRDTTENLAFDPESGSPVLSHSADGFHNLTLQGSMDPHDGSYYMHSIPAWWHYAGLGQKAHSEGAILYSDLNGTASGYNFNKRFVREGGEEHHYLTVSPSKPGGETKALKMFASGDLVSITSGEGTGIQYLGIYHVGNIVGNRIELLPTSYSLRTTLVEERYVDVEIVRSGRSNRLTANAGQFTTYGQPPVIVNHPLGP